MDQLHRGSWIESLGTHPSEMMQVMKDREVWGLNLELLPRKPDEKADNKEDERKRKS